MGRVRPSSDYARLFRENPFRNKGLPKPNDVLLDQQPRPIPRHVQRLQRPQQNILHGRPPTAQTRICQARTAAFAVARFQRADTDPSWLQAFKMKFVLAWVLRIAEQARRAEHFDWLIAASSIDGRAGCRGATSRRITKGRAPVLNDVSIGKFLEDSYVKASSRDPAERSSYLRYFYRNWRPTRMGRIWNGAYAWVSGLGLTPQILVTLQVKGRNSGRLCSTVLVGASHEGRRYLVSMLGDDSEWVKNVRAARGVAFIKRGRTHPVVLTEIAREKRAPILKAWSQVATSGRKHLPLMPHAPVSAFESIAADYPVFRIDPSE